MVDVLIILAVLFGPIVLLVYLYKYLVSTPLPRWLNLPIGYFAPVVAVMLIIVLLGIPNNYWWHCGHKEGFFAKLACAISKTYEEDAPYFRFLPSDEAMIAHFQRHRADFERLVQLFQGDQSPPDQRSGYFELQRTPEAEEIMERIGVKWLSGDPIKKGVAVGGSQEILEARKSVGILFQCRNHTVIRFNKYLSTVHKDRYYYTPAVDRSENSRTRSKYHVFPTLNEYPPDIGDYDPPCAYRQFEPQWFIGMCQYDK